MISWMRWRRFCGKLGQRGMIDNHYSDRRLAGLYDLENPWSSDTDFYLSLYSKQQMNILDLGCGTGLLACAFAEKGHSVTGVDPSMAMVDIARTREAGNKVQWMVSSAQAYVPEATFDLVVMTGHVFQVLLTDQDVLDVFRTIQQCLGTNGIFAFESRNPNIDWKKRFAGGPKTIYPSSGGEVNVYTDSVEVNGDRISFTHHYHFSDGTLRSDSVLRFMEGDKIASLLAQSGLSVVALYGNWDCSAFGPASLEMIFKVRSSDLCG
jgi:SAM-dependent methyltransferase